MTVGIETVEIAHGPFAAELVTAGAALRRLEVPDRNGIGANITLGWQDPAEYLATPRYYGAAIGRYANRIAGARFVLDGAQHRLAANDGPNNLHSGAIGFDQRIWRIVHRDAASVAFAYASPDGENGFPGTLEAEVRYMLRDDGLAIAFTATTDQASIVNLTHHGYYNLAGEASGATVLDHLLRIPASAYLQVDTGIPLPGPPIGVAGTPFDFRTPKPIGRDMLMPDPQLEAALGYDHNYVLDDGAGAVRRVATLFHPQSGRVMEVHSTKPGVQFYAGNHLRGGAPGTNGAVYPVHGGLCLEPQFFPDSPNRPDFPSARLDPGQVYRHDMVLRFRVAHDADEAFG
jgi:aldose 1-epimerase